MTEKMKIAQRARMDSAEKWGDFFVSGQPFTAEKKKEYKEDQERVKKYIRCHNYLTEIDNK